MTCEVCFGRIYGNDNDGACYNCAEERRLIVAKLGEDAFQAIVSIAQRIASNKVDDELSNHVSEYDHDRKDPF